MSVGKLVRYGLPFSNVVNTGVATNQITPGRTLENLRLKLGGTTFTKSMISDLKIKANGKTIIEGTGTELDAIMGYRGRTQSSTFLELNFADYSMNNEFDRMVGAFDTSLGVLNITTEVTINGATAPTLTPILIESASQKDNKGNSAPYAPLISKILRYPFNISTGGRLPVNVPFGPNSGSIIKRLHVFHGGTLTGGQVKEDGLVIFESSTISDNNQEQNMQGRSPKTNCFTVDFCVDGDIRKALDTRQSKSLEWLFDFSGASSGTVYVEYLDPLGNL